jgi:hypothetical protein
MANESCIGDRRDDQRQITKELHGCAGDELVEVGVGSCTRYMLGMDPRHYGGDAGEEGESGDEERECGVCVFV